MHTNTHTDTHTHKHKQNTNTEIKTKFTRKLLAKTSEKNFYHNLHSHLGDKICIWTYQHDGSVYVLYVPRTKKTYTHSSVHIKLINSWACFSNNFSRDVEKTTSCHCVGVGLTKCWRWWGTTTWVWDLSKNLPHEPCDNGERAISSYMEQSMEVFSNQFSCSVYGEFKYL